MDDIEHLDFDPDPQRCECRGCPSHNGRCHEMAEVMVEVHAINHCNRLGLTTTGGVVQLCCATCVRPRMKRASEMASRLDAVRTQFGRTIECQGCGRPLLEAYDFFEMRSLEDV
jgi:hypothetical protein